MVKLCLTNAIALTAFKAIGRMAFPETPPYVVLWSFPTFGHAVVSCLIPIRPLTVFVAVTPSAPPSQYLEL